MTIRVLLKALAVGVGTLMPFSAGATTIDLDQLYAFVFDGAGTDLRSGTIPTTINPVPIAVGASPWTFTLDGPARLKVLDLYLATDQFEISDGTLGSLGLTSTPGGDGACGGDVACAWADPSYSRRIFVLTQGSYSITGVQTLGAGGSGVFIVTPIPLPAALPLFGTGLAAISLLGWRRRRAAAPHTGEGKLHHA